ncbi:MAG: hypothetical protein LBK12_01245 [Odoribacteraceae bacterium]|nr:hypothetical protein [Odoribacteraceae bacterium]
MKNPFEEQPARSTFLTVLCVLTFIGSGLTVLSASFSLLTFNPETMVKQVEATSMLMEEGGPWLKYALDSSVEVLLVTAEHGRAIYGFTLLFGLLSLAGAFEMFRSRRHGFFLYAFAQVAALFVLPCYAGFSLIVTVSLFGAALLSALFIALYAVNLKQMR